MTFLPLLGPAAGCVAFGQSLDKVAGFEVASVKPNRTVRHGKGGGLFPSPGMLTIRNLSLKDLIMEAYRLRAYQVHGGPEWLDDDGYDIIAKAPTGASAREMMPMLQSLLAERFRLAVHREIRQLPGYWLVVGKNGPRLAEPSEADTSRPGDTIHRGEIVGNRQSMERLSSTLSSELRIPILDKTNLKGSYNFTLQWSLSEFPATMENGTIPEAELERPSLFTAVQELGLKLERRPIAVEVVVVDRAERPTEN